MAAAPRLPDSVDQFCHDVKTPLTTIRAQAQLLARAIRRSSALSTEEQDKLVAGLSSIDNAVLQAVSRIDGFAAGEAGPEARDSRNA
jgi:nitrogen-specific signal transduction histidine kinase